MSDPYLRQRRDILAKAHYSAVEEIEAQLDALDTIRNVDRLAEFRDHAMKLQREGAEHVSCGTFMVSFGRKS